jgi:hypothetical protein
MRYVDTSGDVALDRAAYGAFTDSNPFPPLPSEFSGEYLALHFTFYYNPDRGDLPASPANQSSQPSRLNEGFIAFPRSGRSRFKPERRHFHNPSRGQPYAPSRFFCHNNHSAIALIYH